jgi:hypothetical protein
LQREAGEASFSEKRESKRRAYPKHRWLVPSGVFRGLASPEKYSKEVVDET